MAAFNFYLNFPGNTEEAFNFYKSVFGGDFLTIMRFGDNPTPMEIPAEVKNKVMHIALPVGNGSMLMGTDAIDGFAPYAYAAGNNMHISIGPDSEQETRRIFDGLSAGGTVTMPLDQQFWGLYGAFTDKYGINWMVNYAPPQQN